MNIEFKVVNHAANLNRTLSFDSDGHNILTKFMNRINFVRILYPYNQSYRVLFSKYGFKNPLAVTCADANCFLLDI